MAAASLVANRCRRANKSYLVNLQSNGFGCGQDDVNWLQLGDGSETVRCDDCGAEFALPVTAVFPVVSTRRADG